LISLFTTGSLVLAALSSTLLSGLTSGLGLGASLWYVSTPVWNPNGSLGKPKFLSPTKAPSPMLNLAYAIFPLNPGKWLSLPVKM